MMMSKWQTTQDRLSKGWEQWEHLDEYKCQEKNRVQNVVCLAILVVQCHLLAIHVGGGALPKLFYSWLQIK